MRAHLEWNRVGSWLLLVPLVLVHIMICKRLRPRQVVIRPFVAGLVIGVRFTGGSNVLSASLFQPGFGGINLLGGIAVDREQCSATFDRALISLRFVFWNTKSDERSNYAADRPANSQARQRSDNRTRRDERSHTRNGERPDARQQAERTTDYAASCDASGGTLGSFGVFLVRECAGAFVIRHKN